MAYRIRLGTLSDQSAIYSLYQTVARESDGLARRPEEITDGFVREIIQKSLDRGLILVLADDRSEQVYGVIHAAVNSIGNLNHVMNDLTLLVHPSRQGQGLGKTLFGKFLAQVDSNFPHVSRVELHARASNPAAIGLYVALGFRHEGILRGRIRNRNGEIEDGVAMARIKPPISPHNAVTPASADSRVSTDPHILEHASSDVQRF